MSVAKYNGVISYFGSATSVAQLSCWYISAHTKYVNRTIVAFIIVVKWFSPASYREDPVSNLTHNFD
jgi:hypothetical protein